MGDRPSTSLGQGVKSAQEGAIEQTGKELSHGRSYGGRSGKERVMSPGKELPSSPGRSY